ncbi:phage holin family protein [Bradyrhizobium sp.]|uniref:phage holin family protein n=1 Tax=Bradyrhizobium sp. TaxID=376 RepID=UPI002736DA11|nr:phage holin family protein [Bradyrhizobium sp.]MDP3691470.1 phage holin family protein [Bradyrhizobium sp.]
MLALSSGLLRTGLALKLNQIKRATRSYMRDRADQATGTATSYAVAGGMFAAAGIFGIAALLVGAAALFRWIEINYGLFQAFGATGGLLVTVAAICAAMAASRLKRPARQFPSLASRLRVAINANPVKPARVEAATNTATAILREPATPVSGACRARRASRPGPAVDSRKVQAGLLVAATLLGWAAVRRQQARRPAP